MTSRSSRPASSLTLDPHGIRLSRVRVLRGPNMWHLGPLITCELNSGGYALLAPDETLRFIGRLQSILPPAIEAPGPPVIPRILGAIALELQRRSGSSADFLDVRPTAEPEWIRVSVGYEHEDVGLAAIHDALDIVRATVAGEAIDVEPTLRDLSALTQRRALGPGARSMVAQAKRRGIPVRRFEDEPTIQLGLGKHQRRIDARLSSHGGETIDELFPPDTSLTVPVVAVTGTNGKTTTTRLIAHLVRRDGRAVGYTTTDGTYIGDKLVDSGDNTGPYSANIILSSSDIEIAVLEVARGGIIRAGLGIDEVDVGVVLNVTSDHLGIGDIDTIEQLAELKAVIPAVVKTTGVAVLNADDPLVAKMRARTRGRIAWFTTGRTDGTTLLQQHLENGGIVAGVDGEEFVIRYGSTRMPIARAHDVPLTFEGAARFQYENILAALLAGFALDLDADALRHGLMSFLPSAEATPGRLNIIRTTRGRIVVDYAHNAAAIRGLVDFVTNLAAGKRIAVIGAPGDRRDEDLREAGRLFGSFDHVIVKEVEKYRRGRRPGETAELIAEGLRDGGLDAARIEVIQDEPAAVDRAVTLMDAHAILVILADDHAKVLDQLGELGLSG